MWCVSNVIYSIYTPCCGCEVLLQCQALSKCCLLREAQNVSLYLHPPWGLDWVELWHFCCPATEESLYNPNCVLLLSASLFTKLVAAGDDVPSSEWSMQAPKSPKCDNYHAQCLRGISITVCCLAVNPIYYEGAVSEVVLQKINRRCFHNHGEVPD